MYFLESLPDDQVIFECPDGRFQVEQVIGVAIPSRYLRPATSVEIVTINTGWLNGY